MGSETIGNIVGIGTFGFENNSTSEACTLFEGLLSSVIGLMTMVAGVWFVILLITSAYSWMSSGGDKVAVETARKKMINAVIGLVIVIAAVFIADLLGGLIGFPSILNPAESIGCLTGTGGSQAPHPNP